MSESKTENGDLWMFPKCTLYHGFIGAQVMKIVEETNEVSFEWQSIRGDNKPDLTELGMETLDLIHACETLLRNLFTDFEIKNMIEWVIKKNTQRGYYDELGEQS